MRETINPAKEQSSTPKMRTTQFISIYLIIFTNLYQFTNQFTVKILDEYETIETKWKFKLIFYAKIESKPIQQIKKMGRN